MGISNQEKVRRHRERRRQGNICITVEVCVEQLIDCGVLGEWDENDRGAVRQAIEDFLKACAKYGVTIGPCPEYRS
jgi:hypothetical protein